MYENLVEAIEKRISMLQNSIDNVSVTGDLPQCDKNRIIMLQTCIDEDKKIIELIQKEDPDLQIDPFGL